MYRSPILPSKALKSSPPSPNRNQPIRSTVTVAPFRPPSPTQSYYPSYRTNSPGQIPITYSYGHTQPKNPYIAQPTAIPRNGIYYNNNGSINQSQYVWYNGHHAGNMSDNWNEKNYPTSLVYQNAS